MSKAKFVFHGIFPDVIEPGDTPKEIAKVLFDAEYNREFHSHLLADIELFRDEGEFEVRCELPFDCKKFASAVIHYYQYALGPQAKGASIATHNVIRAQWVTELDVED